MNALPRAARWYLYSIWMLALAAIGITIWLSRATPLAPFFLLGALICFVLADYYEVEFRLNDRDTFLMTVVEAQAVFMVAIAQAQGVLVVLVGSVLVDLIRKRAWYKGLFNAAQRSLTYLTMLGVYLLVSEPGAPAFAGLQGLVALVLIALIYYPMNTILVSTIAALASGRSLLRTYLMRLSQVHWVYLITLPLGAMLAYAWDTNPWLVVPCILPLLMAHRSFTAMAGLQKESLRSQSLAQQAQQLAARIEGLQETTTTMLASVEPIPLLKTVSARLAQLFEAPASWAVLLIDQPQLIPGSGSEPSLAWHVDAYAAELTNDAVHVVDEAAITRLHGAGGLPWPIAVLIPMRSRNRMIGCLCLALERPIVLTDNDRRALRAFADQAALAIERMSLFAQLKAQQEDLIRSSKLAALGTFAAGIAHEFNNLLTAIGGYAQLGLTTDDVTEKDEALEVAQRAAIRGQSITSGLLTFARRRDSRREHVQMADLVRETTTLVQREFEKVNVTIALELEPTRATLCDPGQIAQVLMNLLTNARDAMASDDGGVIRIALAEREGMIELAVADTGVGIPEQMLSQIFQPFITTKGALGGSKTPGTGLGLAISHGIIESHGGTIQAQSTVGKGTTMIIRLPIDAPAEATAPTEHRGDDEAPGRVLVVDDEPEIADSIRRLLHRHGYAVAVAHDGQEALERYRRDPFDLVITDVIMPGMNGLDLLQALRMLNPEVAVLAVTGHSSTPQVNAMVELGVIEVLMKPFTLEALLKAVRRGIAMKARMV